jgi:hypothetical protein
LVLGSGVAVAALTVAVAAGTSLLPSGEDSEETAEAERGRPAELPRGGRSIFPEWRVVAFYGAPQDRELGALGSARPERVMRRLARQAEPYGGGDRRVLPALELISTIVQSDPGDDGDHAAPQDAKVIRRYLRAARRRDMLLILDVQPGYASFLDEVKALRPFLKEPDVSIALDPEWSMKPPELPGQVIGSTDAETINALHVASRARERPTREASGRPSLHRRDDRERGRAAAVPGGRADGERRRLRHARGKALEVPRLHARPARSRASQRLQALLQGGHQPAPPGPGAQAPPCA